MDWDENERYFAPLHDRSDDMGRLGYAAVASQGSRFATVFGTGTLAGASVLDYGCGLADLYKLAIQLGQLPARYLGVELTVRSADRARERLAALWGGTLPGSVDCVERRAFESVDIEFDLVACLSVLIVPEGSRERTLALWRGLLDRLWLRTRAGGRMVVDFRRSFAGDPPHVVALAVADVVDLAESFTGTYLLDCSRADHVATLVLSKAPTFAREYWSLRESLAG
jgi:SAM-dependent methyltransferase